MVSPIRWRSQKGLALQKERSLMYFVILALILGLAFRWPREFWFVLAIFYLVSGPLMKLWSIAFPSRTAVAGFNPPEVPTTSELPPPPEIPPAG
jgi:hypothetical protein